MVVSGARNLSLAWSSKMGDNLYMAAIPEGLDCRSLFLGGERKILARYPNGDSSYPQPEGYLQAKVCHTSTKNSESIVCFQGSPDFDTREGEMVTVNAKVYNSNNGQLVTTGKQH